jgi:hypothetical protein
LNVTPNIFPLQEELAPPGISMHPPSAPQPLFSGFKTLTVVRQRIASSRPSWVHQLPGADQPLFVTF